MFNIVFIWQAIMAERELAGELERIIGKTSHSGQGKPILALDTYGTMIGGLNVKQLNEAMFKYGQSHLGFSPEQEAQLRTRYEKDSKAPDYINETDPYKARLITLAREGKIELGFQADFFADVPELLETAVQSRVNVVTLTKGGEHLLKAFYDSPLPRSIKVGDRTLSTYGEVVPAVSTSSDKFKFQKKDDPRCYAEFLAMAEKGGLDVRCYVTDDEKEAKAARIAFNAYRTLRGREIPVIHIPEEAHKQFIQDKKPTLVKREDGIYQTNTLLALFQIEELIPRAQTTVVN